MALVIGGWGLFIVAFGVAATLNLSVRERSKEIALLKSVGATPAQIGRLVIGEAAAVSALAAIIAIPFGLYGGRAMLASLTATHRSPQVSATTSEPSRSLWDSATPLWPAPWPRT